MKVAFSVSMFRNRYPEFGAVPDLFLAGCWDEAGLYLSNTDASTTAEDRRAILLNMLTAHIATLGGALAEDGQVLPVGRLSHASEGSVSADFAFNAVPGSQEWFSQTQYGAAFWQATANLRGFRYAPHVRKKLWRW